MLRHCMPLPGAVWAIIYPEPPREGIAEPPINDASSEAVREVDAPSSRPHSRRLKERGTIRNT